MYKEINHLAEILRETRLKLAEYDKKNSKRELSVNAVEIAVCLIEYGIYEKRPITRDEEKWFDAGWYLINTFENTEFEDIASLYHELRNATQKINYFRDK